MPGLTKGLVTGIATVIACVPAIAQTRAFDLPALPAEEALRRFAVQSGANVIAPSSTLEGIVTRPVRGARSVGNALDAMLDGTPLKATRSRSGAYYISRRRPVPMLRHPRRLPVAPPQRPAAIPGTGDIVVTAQRRSENAQTVPISFGVVPGDLIVEQGLSTLAALSERQALVVIRPAAGGDQIAIRGASSGYNPGFEQSVATFMDGVYRPRARSSRIALFDVERVEILKGPQTTFFGANAIAGALNITSRKPRPGFGVNIALYHAPASGESSREAGADLPITSNLAMRIAGRLSRADAIAHNVRLNRQGTRETEQARLSARFVRGDVTIDGRFDYAHMRNSGDNSLEIVGCPPVDLPPTGQCARALATLGTIDDRLDGRVATGFLDRFWLDLYEGAATTTVDLGLVSLVMTSSYQDQRAGVLIDNINAPIDSPLRVSALIPSRVAERYRKFSHEMRVQSQGDGPITYMLGSYFERGQTMGYSRTGFFQDRFGAQIPASFQPDDLIVAAVDSRQTARTLSTFATMSYAFASGLTAATGLRYSRIVKQVKRQAFYGTIAPFPWGTAPPIGQVVAAPLAGQTALAQLLGLPLGPYPVNRRSDDGWMPSATLSYRITPDIMAYLTYVHGFKAGGFNLLIGLETFGPEQADNYEFGIKASWFDRRLTTNLTVFRTDYAGLQEAGNLFTGAGLAIPFIGNVARSRAQGVELEWNAALDGNFRILGNLAYLDARYRDYPDAPCSSYQIAIGEICPQTNLAGRRRSNAPRWSGSVTADYKTALSHRLIMGFEATISFRSKYYLQTLPEEITAQPAYAKAGLRASLGAGNGSWSLALLMNNLFDKRTASFAGNAPTSPGTTQRIIDRGRVVGLQLSVNLSGL
ncbi:MAG: TonB-dependent receptor [Sphingobium sp.]